MKKFLVFLLMSLVVSSLSIAQKKSDDASDYQSKSFAVQKGGLLTVDVEPGAVRIGPLLRVTRRHLHDNGSIPI